MSHEPARVWVAYFDDLSEFVIFSEEIDALRYAVQHAPMEVAHVELGRGVREQMRERWKALRG